MRQKNTVEIFYYNEGVIRAPRYNQINVVNRIIEVVVNVANRILLVMTTGTFKT